MPRFTFFVPALVLASCLSVGSVGMAQDGPILARSLGESPVLVTDVPPFISVDAIENREDAKRFSVYFTFIGDPTLLSIQATEGDGKALQVEAFQLARMDALTYRMTATLSGWNFKAEAMNTACVNFMVKQPSGKLRWLKSMALLAPHFEYAAESTLAPHDGGKPDFDQVFKTGCEVELAVNTKVKMGLGHSNDWVIESSARDLELKTGEWSYSSATPEIPYANDGITFKMRALTPGIKHLKITNDHGHVMYKSIYVSR